eukprot:TRINITY_DN11641_c0_g1_i7.p1 TRINITY_DN11641_c0_g1~~TRINITY_DN11641_c0_g1_i7.p1  ORF type:complete len:181 (+),score=12.38 TRINITY_DN11641_c0_g1_i7:70-612(+)
MPWVALLLLAASAYPRDRTGCDRDESAGREFIARVRERPGARTFGCFDGAETCVVYEWLAQPQEGRVYRLSGTAPRARFAHNLTLWDGRARGSSDGSAPEPTAALPPGVRDALRRMCFGDHWRLYLPHERCAVARWSACPQSSAGVRGLGGGAWVWDQRMPGAAVGREASRRGGRVQRAV